VNDESTTEHNFIIPCSAASLVGHAETPILIKHRQGRTNNHLFDRCYTPKPQIEKGKYMKPILDSDLHRKVESILAECISEIKLQRMNEKEFIGKFMHLIAAIDQRNMNEIITYTKTASYSGK